MEKNEIIVTVGPASCNKKTLLNLKRMIENLNN